MSESSIQLHRYAIIKHSNNKYAFIFNNDYNGQVCELQRLALEKVHLCRVSSMLMLRSLRPDRVGPTSRESESKGSALRAVLHLLL